MAVVRLTLDLDVGDAPYLDAVSWFIHQYGSEVPERLGGEGNVLGATEAVVLDVLSAELLDHDQAPVGWRVLASHVEAVA